LARNLRLMLIDDDPVTELETRFLELQQVPYNESESDPSLGTWAQHLRLWSDNLFCVDEPDLVLVDCRFEQDNKYAPMTPELRGYDPRGLMHGAIFVSRLFGRDRFHPFGFSVYSMDASAFHKDAYAQTFMGFLLAMRDSTIPPGQVGAVKGRRARELSAICGEELGKTIKQNPATAWGPALQMYRQRLKEVADLQAIVIDSQSYLQLIDVLQRQDTKAIGQGVGLTWRRYDGELDTVDIRSLFADQLSDDAWTEDGSKQALEWLQGLLVLGDYLGDAVDWVEKILIQGQEPEDSSIIRGRDIHGQKLTRFFHACLGLIAWYENRMNGEVPLSSSALILELGLSDKQLNRYFKPILSLPWGKVVDKLDEGLRSGVWPLPGRWELHSVLDDWCRRFRNDECTLRGPWG
jgi:hypothetical protein